MKPDCVSDISLIRTVFHLLAIAVEAILYRTDKSEMGRQFFKNFRGLSPFGRQLITHVLRETDNSPVSKAKFKARKTKYFSLSQKVLKNSAGNPSTPGHLLFFICFKALLISSSFSLPSSFIDSVGVSLYMFFPSNSLCKF